MHMWSSFTKTICFQTLRTNLREFMPLLQQGTLCMTAGELPLWNLDKLSGDEQRKTHIAMWLCQRCEWWMISTRSDWPPKMMLSLHENGCNLNIFFDVTKVMPMWSQLEYVISKCWLWPNIIYWANVSMAQLRVTLLSWNNYIIITLCNKNEWMKKKWMNEFLSFVYRKGCICRNWYRSWCLSSRAHAKEEVREQETPSVFRYFFPYQGSEFCS